MKKHILIILVTILPLSVFCQKNDYYKVRLNEIIDYQILLTQITHVGPEFINSQPKISKTPLIDSLDLYLLAIDSYMKENNKTTLGFQKNSILFEIILEAKNFEKIVRKMIDERFVYSTTQDDISGGYSYMIYFLADLGNEKINHSNSVDYCLQRIKGINNGNKEKQPTAYDVVAYLYYLRLVSSDDKKVMRNLKKILDGEVFFDKEAIRNNYCEFFEFN